MNDIKIGDRILICVTVKQKTEDADGVSYIVVPTKTFLNSINITGADIVDEEKITVDK